MNINSISIPHIEAILEKIRKKLGSKPIQNTPILALRSPLEGPFVNSCTGIPLVLYKWGDYGRKESIKYSFGGQGYIQD